MIKLGTLMQGALAKDFPDKWILLATMMAKPFEMYDNDSIIEIEINDTSTLKITKDNEVSCDTGLADVTIAKILVAAANAANGILEVDENEEEEETDDET